MSLINQMLKDLEARRAPQLHEHSDTIKGVNWTLTGRLARRRHMLMATLVGSVLCSGIAVANFYHLGSEPRGGTVAAVAPRVPATASPRQAAADVEPVSAEGSDVASGAAATMTAVEPARDDTHREADEARQMLAALVARGALAERADTEVAAVGVATSSRPPPAPKPAPKQVMEDRHVVTPTPQVLVAVDNGEAAEAHTVQKKLRPLENHKLAELNYQQGYELLYRGQQAAGEASLQQALDLMATHTKAREMLAVSYLQQQRVTQAAELLEDGLRLAPDHIAFREIYARVLIAQDKLPEAITMLTNGAPELAREPNYHALLAGLYQQNLQHEQAAATYLQLVKHNPQHSQWWLGLAIAMEKLGKNSEAISAYKKARELKLPARLVKYVDSRLQHLGAGDVAR
ncbi:MAG: tetratricopeptide repeat protein [Gammaproteobacteria bacterium]